MVVLACNPRNRKAILGYTKFKPNLGYVSTCQGGGVTDEAPIVGVPNVVQSWDI